MRIRRIHPPYGNEAEQERIIEETILKQAKKKKHIVHGCRAVNKQLPPEYHRRTRDWDFFSKTPKASSLALEKKIEEAIGYDKYNQDVLEALGTRENVYRIVSKDTGEEIADFMKTPNDKNLYVTISGIRWETLEHAKMAYRRILSNPIYQQRWGKARQDLHRIEAFEQRIGKKQKIRKSDVPEPFVMVRATTVGSF